MTNNIKTIFKVIFHPYAFYSIGFFLVFLHTQYENAFTEGLFLSYMTCTAFFLALMIASLFAIKRDESLLQQFVKNNQNPKIKQLKTFRQFAALAMLYIFLSLNWLGSFIIWAGVSAALMIHQRITEQYTETS